MIPYVDDADFTLYVGDAREVLAELSDESVHCCVTSPPYYALRDYGVDGQIGLEASPLEYVDGLVGVFGELRRVLRSDGTLWLNLGDSYAAKARGSDVGWAKSRLTNPGTVQKMQAASLRRTGERHRGKSAGFKHKDLLGIPWRVAFALQEDGWWLRRDIVWWKPNALPESAQDRPTTAHEYLFLLTKSARYFYDAEAVKEPAAWERWGAQTNGKYADVGKAQAIGDRRETLAESGQRHLRSVWPIPTQPFPEAHFAVFPPALVEPCILASTSAAGGCSECGAPARRLVEIDRLHPDSHHDHSRDAEQGRSQRRADGTPAGTIMREASLAKRTRTTGWERTCDHGAPLAPAVVLDPFGGAGTTALVARKHGRHSILIELNAAYAELAARRLAQLSLLAEGKA